MATGIQELHRYQSSTRRAHCHEARPDRRVCGKEDRMNRVWQLPLIGLVFLLTACQQQQAALPRPRRR